MPPAPHSRRQFAIHGANPRFRRKPLAGRCAKAESRFISAFIHPVSNIRSPA